MVVSHEAITQGLCCGETTVVVLRGGVRRAPFRFHPESGQLGDFPEL